MPPRGSKRKGSAGTTKSTKTPAKSTNSNITKAPANLPANAPKSALKKSGKSVSFTGLELSDDDPPPATSATAKSVTLAPEKAPKKAAEVMIILHIYLDATELLSTVEMIDASLDDAPGYDRFISMATESVEAAMAVQAPGKMAIWPIAWKLEIGSERARIPINLKITAGSCRDSWINALSSIRMKCKTGCNSAVLWIIFTHLLQPGFMPTLTGDMKMKAEKPTREVYQVFGPAGAPPPIQLDQFSLA